MSELPSPDGPILSQSKFTVQVIFYGEEEDPKCQVAVSVEDDEGVPFPHLMCATEYMMALSAKYSKEGFEKAMELLMQGATTYKDIDF